MKSRGDALEHWLLVVPCVLALSCHCGVQAASLRATRGGAAATEWSATLAVAQARDEPSSEASLANPHRRDRIARIEQLGRAEMLTLLRQEQAVEVLAKEQAAVQAQEKRLEETQERIQKKLELLRRGGRNMDKVSATNESNASTTAATSETTTAAAAATSASETAAPANTNATASNTSETATGPKADTPERPPFEKFMIEVVYSKESFAHFFAYLFWTTIVALAYQAGKKPPVKLPHDDVHMEEWQYKLMDCHDCGRDWPICCWALWCGAIRWADTVSNPSIAIWQFWSALIFFELMTGLTGLTLGFTGIILVCVAVNNRQRIRRAYGIPHGTVQSLCWDCVAWVCCACCAMAQEARQVDLVEALPDFSGKVSPEAPPQATMRQDGPLTPAEERGPAEPLRGSI